ncbi:MAG: hypothetical protein ACI4S2_03685 [Lachnospiraceae bacterium]
MKRKLLATFSISLCLLLSACGGGASENTKQETVKEEDSGQQEIELSMNNVNDYIDFVSIGNDEWIVLNKQYENGLVYISDSIDISLELSFIDINGEKSSNITDGGDLNFTLTIVSLDKPIIKDIKGTITFYKGANAYIDDIGHRIVEYGTSTSAEESTRAKYFNEYPY